MAEVKTKKNSKTTSNSVKSASKKKSIKTTSKKTTRKTNVKSSESTKLKKICKKFKKYVYPSAIFALMMTLFNYLFMIISIYSKDVTGLYVWAIDNVVINVILNTIFDFLFFFVTFLTYTYLLIEMLILPEK